MSDRAHPGIADARRVAGLNAYGILDTPPESGFDDIVALACEICEAPIALVSFVAADRQWFKARIGFEPCQTSLDQSVCAHALGQSDLLVIPNLAQDSRTCTNPLVTGEPHLRFYAGAPLESADGTRLGTLCVMDRRSRPFGLTERQGHALRRLAAQVIAQMELRRADAERERILAEQQATVAQHEALIATQAAVSVAGGELDAVLAAVVAGALRAVPHAEGAAVELRKGEELVYRAGAGNLERHVGLRLPLNGSLSGACLLADDAILCPDVLLDGRVRREVVAPLGMRSAVYVPVSRAGTTIGVLKLQSGQVGAFAERDVEVARLLAGTVAGGLSQTDEAEARRRAHLSEGRYKAVFESAIDYAIIVLDLDGIVTDWNEGATRILGWEPGSMCGKPADTFFTPEDRAAGIPGQEMHSALTEGRGIDERWHLRVTGERFWANGEMMALRDEAGEAIGFVKMLRDRTEQRRAAQALQDQTDLLRTITDHLGQAVFQMDASGRITFANPAAEAMFGWPAEEIVGRSLHDTLHHSHPDGRPFPAEDCSFVQALRHGQTLRDREDTFFRKDGSAVSVVVTNAPVHVDGAVASAVVTVSDITHRRAGERRQSALLRLVERLRDLDTVPAMTWEAARIVGDVMGASRVGFGLIDAEAGTLDLEPDWTAPGQISIAGRHSYADYGDLLGGLLQGIPAVVDDVTQDPRTAADVAQWRSIGVAALVNMPVRERGRTVAVHLVHDTRPRVWQPDEIAFLQAVADRVEVGVARLRAEERQQLLNRELSHRMKNLLAMVQSIASQTMRNAADLEGARDVFAGRLLALGNAHDLLMGGSLTSTDIEAVMRSALSVHDDGRGRFRLVGPALAIGMEQALSLSLMLHELATNATKYGALSGEGHVDIRWGVLTDEHEPRLRLSWEEIGGPPVRPPTRKGFGSRFIERGLATQVGGDLALAYPPTGVTCVLTAPLAAFQSNR